MQKVHRWQYQFLGTTSLSKSVSPVELQAFFTFSDEELAALGTRRKDTLKIAAAVQLGFLKMSGCPLSDLKSIPLRLLRHVAQQLEVAPVSIATVPCTGRTSSRGCSALVNVEHAMATASAGMTRVAIVSGPATRATSSSPARRMCLPSTPFR